MHEKLVDITNRLEHNTKTIETVTMTKEDYGHIQEHIYELTNEVSDEILEREAEISTLYKVLELVVQADSLPEAKEHVSRYLKSNK